MAWCEGGPLATRKRWHCASSALGLSLGVSLATECCVCLGLLLSCPLSHCLRPLIIYCLSPLHCWCTELGSSKRGLCPCLDYLWQFSRALSFLWLFTPLTLAMTIVSPVSDLYLPPSLSLSLSLSHSFTLFLSRSLSLSLDLSMSRFQKWWDFRFVDISRCWHITFITYLPNLNRLAVPQEVPLNRVLHLTTPMPRCWSEI